MATVQTKKETSPKAKTTVKNENGNGAATRTRSSNNRKRRAPSTPSWLGTAASFIGVTVAIGAGLYATRHQWMSKAEEWRENFSGAFAEDETDYENFDQTRNAGLDSMRDDHAEDWEDIDDMSDASFPASDPPSFNPGTA